MYEYECTIRKVVDGDTIDVDINLGFNTWINNERVRLYGIDTPESRTRDLEEKKFGLYAKSVVDKYLPVGSKQVLVTHLDKVGKFGRILGEFRIYDGEQDRQTTINEYMIRKSIGVEYKGQSKDEIKQQHLKNREVLYEQGTVEKATS
tara:strand:+ start:1469 stop:1912 length:444 start_codon:yes stop_codon:yes gene_type:complete